MSKIVLRHREHPELSADDHAAIISVSLASPWWSGVPGPEVVYGNAALFERALESARARLGGGPVIEKPPPRRYGRGMTTREILNMTQTEGVA